MEKKKKLKELKCRMMRKRHLEEVSHLVTETFGEVTAHDLKPRLCKHSNEKAMVALKGDKVVGFILFNLEGEQIMYVANVGVSDKARSRGVCGKMLRWLTARLDRHDCNRAYLFVDADNASAVRCYRRCGFKKKKGRMDYYAE